MRTSSGWCGVRELLAATTLVAIVLLLLSTCVNGFQPTTHTRIQTRPQPQLHDPRSLNRLAVRQRWLTVIHSCHDDNGSSNKGISNEDDEDDRSSRFQKIKNMQRAAAAAAIGRFMPKSCQSLRLVLSMAMAVSVWTGHLQPPSAAASAPVMALPKAEGRDPVTEVMTVHERKMAVAAQCELTEMAAQARAIEAKEGEAARIAFERDFKQAQVERAATKVKAVQQLKRELLEQGFCPFTDLEGQRQVVALEKGVDLGKIQGTPFHLEKEWEAKRPERSMMVKKAANRRVVACMVQDMINRGIDPLEYFEKHQDQTEAILNMKPEQAERLVQQYEANLELYGQITVPKEGEMSAKENMAKFQNSNENQKAERQAAKAKAAELNAAAKAKAAQLKTAAKAEKAKLQLQAKADKQATKEGAKQAAAVAAAAAVAGATVAAQEAAAAAQGLAGNFKVQSPSQPEAVAVTEPLVMDSDDDEEDAFSGVGTSAESSTVSAAIQKQQGSVVPKAAVAAIVVAAGGGGFALKMYRDKAAADEEERKRQFLLLMVGTNPKNKASPITSRQVAPALEEFDTDDLTEISTPAASKKKNGVVPPPPKPTPPPPAPVEMAPIKKKRLGIKSVFGKKKSERETDLMALVSSSSDAEAPEFATILAKILTFGAPGRFPAVVALSRGDMPMETFALEDATKKLVEAQEAASLTVEQSAEIFANVVNCMLIEIVDLASTSLKENDDKVTIDAINIVVDFMNHAASLYTSIADGVTIKPVIYGGDLSKSKLEQMFSTYASSSMLNPGSLSDDFSSRVSLLQDVFEINEKKAEGLMMKAMQKNMAQMMKDGKGMEGMEEMMKGMGGMDGLAGMGGADGEGPSPEELKEMLTALKEMKDSGSIPPAEFEQVKKQFSEAFGSSIDDVVKEADASSEALSTTDKELLQLMKSIMDD